MESNVDLNSSMTTPLALRPLVVLALLHGVRRRLESLCEFRMTSRMAVEQAIKSLPASMERETEDLRRAKASDEGCS
jgi:hypothetical protein